MVETHVMETFKNKPVAMCRVKERKKEQAGCAGGGRAAVSACNTELCHRYTCRLIHMQGYQMHILVEAHSVSLTWLSAQ